MSSVTRRIVDIETALAAVAAVLAKAKELGVTISVAVTDQDGSVKASARMDGASSLTAELALNKAYTSASLGMATHEVHDFVKSDPPLLHGFSQYPRIIIFGGGYPIKEGAKIVGAIGVSGAHYTQDMACATAGLDAIGAAKS